jgi:hypothetical protein
MPRKRAQLVCQHLENVSRDLLGDYPDLFRELAKGRHGVYALYRGNRLYYVGLATNLRGRLNQHLRDRHAQTWDQFSLYLTIGDRHLREIESLLIHISRPSGNRVKPGFARSENLRPGLRRRITARNREKVKQMFDSARRGTKQVPRKKVRRSAKDKGRWPDLADFVTRGFPVTFSFKGKVHTARVRRDGSISYEGKVFSTPSAAALAVTRTASNGWKAWRYERAPGDWVPLDELRR